MTRKGRAHFRQQFNWNQRRTSPQTTKEEINFQFIQREDLFFCPPTLLHIVSLIWFTFISKINRETINVLNDVIQHRLLSCSKLRSDSWQKRSRVFLKCPLSHYCSFIYLLLHFKNILFLFCLLLQSGAIVHCPNQLLLSKTKTAGTTQTVPYHQRKRFLWSAHYYLLGPSIISRWFVDISPH